MKPNIALTGMSGSGKTTTSKYLQKNYGYVPIRETDEIHTYLRQKFPLLFQKGETEINSFSYNITQKITKIIQAAEIILKSRGRNPVIVDSCLLQEKVREKIIKLLGKDTLLLYIKCSEEDYLKRLCQREGNQETWLELHYNQKKSFETPTNPNITFDTSEQDFFYLDQELKKHSITKDS